MVALVQLALYWLIGQMQERRASARDLRGSDHTKRLDRLGFDSSKSLRAS